MWVLEREASHADVMLYRHFNSEFADEQIAAVIDSPLRGSSRRRDRAGHEIRRADAHEHSVAAAQLAVEAGRIDLMLQVPGANLVGFEHPPRNGEQRATLDEARRRLAAGAWLVLPEAAGCSSDFEVEMPGFEDDGSTANGEHEHGDEHDYDEHEHEHDHEHDEHEHDEHEHAR